MRGGKGAYIKQPRQRVKDGEFWNQRYVSEVRQDPARSCDTAHATLTLQLQVMLHTHIPPPSENTRRLSGPDLTAPAEARGISSLLRPDIKDKRLQNSSTETEAC